MSHHAKQKRSVFLISDGTGITVESFANSVLSQFPNFEFHYHSFPYTDSIDKIQSICEKIQANYALNEEEPLVFLTMVHSEMIKPLFKAPGHFFDFFNPIVDSLENILQSKSVDEAGRAHGFLSSKRYDQRIEAINYALNCDDGLGNQNYEQADIILIGVSRCGKTPSCLYMALQFGIYAANYPITDESIDQQHLPSSLKPFKHKLFGLTITPQRLHHIRSERRPNSQYASMTQCQYEIAAVESLYQQQHIPFLDSTHYSIEEISTRIMSQKSIERRI
jgi:regulator of PEP synthase PpsR (kinase-PPPase family)